MRDRFPVLATLVVALALGAGVGACVEITEPAPIDDYLGRYALGTVNAQELPVRVTTTFGCELEIQSAELSIDVPDRVVMTWDGRARCGAPDWSPVQEAHGGTFLLAADGQASIDPRCNPIDNLFCFAPVYFAARQPDAALDLLAFADGDPGSGEAFVRLGYRR